MINKIIKRACVPALLCLSFTSSLMAQERYALFISFGEPIFLVPITAFHSDLYELLKNNGYRTHTVFAKNLEDARDKLFDFRQQLRQGDQITQLHLTLHGHPEGIIFSEEQYCRFSENPTNVNTQFRAFEPLYDFYADFVRIYIQSCEIFSEEGLLEIELRAMNILALTGVKQGEVFGHLDQASPQSHSANLVDLLHQPSYLLLGCNIYDFFSTYFFVFTEPFSLDQALISAIALRLLLFVGFSTLELISPLSGDGFLVRKDLSGIAKTPERAHHYTHTRFIE